MKFCPVCNQEMVITVDGFSYCQWDCYVPTALLKEMQLTKDLIKELTDHLQAMREHAIAIVRSGKVRGGK